MEKEIKNKLLKIYYFFRNPLYRFYCFIFRPKSFGVKVIVENNNKLLMTKISYAHKGWTFPGGGVKKGESFIDSVKRELFEEAGIRVENLIEIGEYFSEKYYRKNIVKVFYVKVDSDFVKIDGFEVIDSGWFTPDKFPKNLSFAVENIMKIYNEFLNKQ